MGQTNEGESPSFILERLQNTPIENEDNISLQNSYNIIRNILSDYKLYKDYISKNQKNNKLVNKTENTKEELINIKKSNYNNNIFKEVEHKMERIKKWVKMSKYSSLDKNKKENSEIFPRNNDNKINFPKNLILSNYSDLVIELGLLKYYQNKPSKFIQRVKKGPPDSFRWCSWCILNYLPQDRNILIYENYTNMILEKENKDRIIRDIERTFTQQIREKKELRKMETSLYKILKSFWNLDKVVGYCQGMNLIVGFILILSGLNERDSFYLMTSMFSNTFKSRKKYDYNIRGLFYEEFPLLNLLNYIFENLLKRHCPELKAHLEMLGITTDLWMGRWFHTMFTIVLPITWCKRLWDNFFAENIFFLVKFGVYFSKILQNDILKMEDEEQILNYFKKYEKFSLCDDNEALNTKYDLNKIIEKSQKLNIDIEFYLQNYEKLNPGFIQKLNKIENIKYEFVSQLVRKPSNATILFHEEDNTKGSLNKSLKNNNKINIEEKEIIVSPINQINQDDQDENINEQNNKEIILKNIKNSFSNENSKQKIIIDNSSENISPIKDINLIEDINKQDEKENINIIKKESDTNETIDSVNDEYEDNEEKDKKFANIIKQNINLHKFENFLNRNRLDIFAQKKPFKTFERKKHIFSFKGRNEIIGLHIPNEDDTSAFIGKNKFKFQRKIDTEKKNNNDINVDKEKIDQWCF